MFLIQMTDALPEPDTMPVIKTTEYPWTDGSFRPLMYTRASYLAGEGLFLDFMAFERAPDTASQLLDASCAAASLCAEGGPVLTAAADSTGRVGLFRDGVPDGELTAELYAGDDEQGWYWGARLCLSDDLLARYGFPSPLTPGQEFCANFYKFLRAGEHSHFGAAAPVSGPFIFSRDDLAPAAVTVY